MTESQIFSRPAQSNLPPFLRLILLGIYSKLVSMNNDELRELNENLMCPGLDGFFRTGSCQPVRHYTLQLANMLFMEWRQRGRSVV